LGRRSKLDLSDAGGEGMSSRICELPQQQTVANKKRLEEKDPRQRAARAADLAATAADPERHRQFLLRSSLLASVAKAKTLA
jgi:3-(3-hydroxy-phenyl)propionate hydroxylase